MRACAQRALEKNQLRIIAISGDIWYISEIKRPNSASNYTKLGISAMIEFGCKNCGKKLSVQDQHSGKRVKCPKCGSVGVVPDNLPKIKFQCKNCGQSISVPQIHAGKKGKCPKCKNPVVVPLLKKEPADSTGTVSVVCSMCNEAVQVPETSRGQTIECPECGSYIETSSGGALSESDASIPPRADEDLYQEETEEYEESESVYRQLMKIGGLALKAIGVLTIAASMIAFAATFVVGGCIGGAIGGLVGIILATIGSRVFQRGKQYTARAAAEKALKDPRAPVLYLRAFKDDELMSKALSTAGGSMLTDHLEIVTQEERLAKAVKSIGPFLAIGRPWEKLPTLGAARHYIHGENWREEILRMLKRARLVIIRAAATQSLMWELKAAKKYLRPEQLVLLVPLDREAYEAFRSQSRRYFPYELPMVFSASDLDSQEKPARDNKKWSDHGIITFDVNWKPSFSSPYTWPWKTGMFRRGPFMAPYAYGLHPVYIQLGVDWREPLNWTSIIAVAFLVVLFLALALACIVNSRS